MQYEWVLFPKKASLFASSCVKWQLKAMYCCFQSLWARAEISVQHFTRSLSVQGVTRGLASPRICELAAPPTGPANTRCMRVRSGSGTAQRSQRSTTSSRETCTSRESLELASGEDQMLKMTSRKAAQKAAQQGCDWGAKCGAAPSRTSKHHFALIFDKPRTAMRLRCSLRSGATSCNSRSLQGNGR